MKTPLAVIAALFIAVPVHSAHVSPGPGWERIGEKRGSWVWRRILPRPGGSQSRGAYELQLTHPKSSNSKVYKTIVNCETWEQFDFRGTDKGKWIPIYPDSNAEDSAIQACK